MVKKFIDRAPVQQLTSWVMLPHRTFYYNAHPGPRGMRASTHTPYNGIPVRNEEVLERIRSVIGGPHNAYGYQMVSDELRELGYLINKKKTYRLMDENNLLLGKVIRCSGKPQVGSV